MLRTFHSSFVLLFLMLYLIIPQTFTPLDVAQNNQWYSLHQKSKQSAFILFEKLLDTFYVKLCYITTAIKRKLNSLYPKNIHIVIKGGFATAYLSGCLLYCEAIFFRNFFHSFLLTPRRESDLVCVLAHLHRYS